MSTDRNYRVHQWTPPPRPDWVRLVNDEGSHLDLKSVVPLDEQSLLDCARANTGLSDFGANDWYEPFKVFLKSLNEEADLNLMGRLMTRSDILMYLEARLRVEETYKRYPQIEQVVLVPQMLIVGSGRSGTSALQNILACDPDNGTPRHWEALFPCPPPEAATYGSDSRIPLAHERMDQWNRVTPQMMSIHEFGGNMPTELIQLEAMSFQALGWLVFCGFTPTFNQYLASHTDGVAGLAYARRVMKLLQWKNPRERWLLKSPDSMRYLPAVFKVFPDIQLIWVHRDPLKTMSSAVSLVGTILWARSDQKMDERFIGQLTNPDGMAALFANVMDQMNQGKIPAKQIHHLQYVDMVADPIEAVEKLYRKMGITFTPQARAAIEKYMREHPREGRPSHQYSSGDVAMRDAERKLFEPYQRTFNVPSEV
ncbi:MAG TPA: sulfotransferase [Steroidobacteraceae bacterium]|nr:sulfotransferase [Steroidobacteraceae bacterium]